MVLRKEIEEHYNLDVAKKIVVRGPEMTVRHVDSGKVRKIRSRREIVDTERTPDICSILNKIYHSLGECCEGFVDTTPRSRTYGRIGAIERYWNTHVTSNSDRIDIRVIGSYENPGCLFTGRADLIMSYLSGTDKEDLEIVRKAITGVGFRK